MSVNLEPFDFARAAARAGMPEMARSVNPGGQDKSESFGQIFSDALEAVSQAQHEVAYLQREVQLDNPAVSIEQTMVAMQKAQIGFQGVLAVRNRLTQAYTEIMNMQV